MQGAAVGVASMLATGGDELAAHLPTLVPKLYRYTYDPDTNVQQSMRQIWKLVTSKHKNVTRTYALDILAELQRSLVSDQWRVRQSR